MSEALTDIDYGSFGNCLKELRYIILHPPDSALSQHADVYQALHEAAAARAAHQIQALSYVDETTADQPIIKY